LPSYIISQMIVFLPHMEDDGSETIGWGENDTHYFIVQNAYLLRYQNCTIVKGDWKIIWKWKFPRRIQTFIWLAMHGRILSNFRRSRWGYSYLSYFLVLW